MTEAAQVVVEYEPSEKQARFHQCNAFEVVYGGAKGGGKSCALIMEAFLYGMEHAGARVYLFRETYDMLEATLIQEWKEKVPEQLYSYNEGKHIATLTNGSTVRFRYVKSFADAKLYQGRSIDFVGVDELTKHEERTIQELLSCVRSPKGFPARFRATCNPGDIGHAWVKKRYIDATEHGEHEVIDDISGNTIAFIPAKVYDNVIIMQNDPAYVRRLENLPEAQRKAYLHGDWDSFEGQAFSEWRNDIHVIDPFEIPSTWKKYRGIDYGRTAPFCCVWVAEDQDHNLYLYQEVYEKGMDAADQARTINAMSAGEEYYSTVLDSACWISNQYGESIADTYANEGLYCDQASKNRLNGKDRVHKWLKVFKDSKGNEYSRFKVFSTCKHFLRTFPALPLDENKIEDVDTHAEDHAYDALRYLLMSIPEPVEGVPTEHHAMSHVATLLHDGQLPHALQDDAESYDWYDL